MEKASPNQIKRWSSLRRQRRARVEEGASVLFGKDEVREFADKLQVRAVFATSEELFHYAPSQAPRFLCPRERWKQISGVEAREGIGLEIAYAPLALKKAGRLVVSDGISDPGNLGAIVRTARAFGFDGMLLLAGSVDLFNDKVLRASKGHALFMPHKYGSIEDLEGYQVIAADSRGGGPSPCDPPFALVFGSEAHGVSPDVLKKAKRVGIAMQEGVESLNVGVAAGILLYEYRR